MKLLFTFLLSITFLFAADATLEINKKIDAYSSFGVEDSSTQRSDLSKKFYRSLVADINVLSLFNVDKHYFTSDFDSNSINVENKKLNYVLKFDLISNDNQSLLIKIKLMELGEVRLDKSYKISKSKMYVFVAHAIASDINDHFGAPSVDWMKGKIILSRLTKPGNSQILVTDYSLTYQHVIINGGLNVFPKWANKEQSAFYFTALDTLRPTLFKVDVRSGNKTKVVDSDGMMICSDVNSDGSKLLLTMAPDDQPDIYLYDVNSQTKERLTSYSGIDVSGQFMEDETIAFVSNRLGYPNIFSKKIGSSAVEQLVYYGKSNASCSAHNEYIVYKARESSNAFSRNTFNLHLISTKTDFIRRLTATGLNEFPRFSHDGDAILFIKNYKQQSSIGIIRLKHNKNFLFPLRVGKIQSMDW